MILGAEDQKSENDSLSIEHKEEIHVILQERVYGLLTGNILNNNCMVRSQAGEKYSSSL